MTIESLITNQIAALGSTYRAFVESEYVETTAAAFAEALQLTGRQVEVLENALTLYLLLIFSREDVIDFLTRNCDLSPSDTESLWTAVEATLPDGVAAAIETTRNLGEGENTLTLEHEIAEAEEALSSLHGIRTMASDMHVAIDTPETVYRSNQDAILEPASTVPPPPRWESDD